MYSFFLLSVASFLFALVLTPLCRNVFRRCGIVDRPDGLRKIHREPVPRAGGIPILLSFVLAFAVLLLSPFSAGGVIRESLPLAAKLLPAAGIVFFTGLLDDIYRLKPWHKLLGQIGAGAWAWAMGVSISGVNGYQFGDWLSLPVTLAWFIGCTNAFNLIDGVDGLATGVGLFATLTILASALLHNNIPLALATAPLAGSLFGFLRYNFNPASIFLGDSGSLTIGFLLGCFGVIWSQKSATLLGMTAPLMVLAIPILDVALSILRRALRGQPIFRADRGHIHHRLLDRGLTPRRVALVLYGVCALFAALSLLSSVSENRYSGAILVLFCVVTWVGVQNLGYVEFRVARRMLLGGAFQNTLNGQLALRKFEEGISSAATVEACWEVVRDSARQFGFDKIHMYVAGQNFEEKIGNAHPEDCWNVRIPLSDSEWVNFSRQYDAEVLPMMVAPFVDAVHSRMRAKMWELEVTSLSSLVFQ